ncbi:hypothetical protein B0H34DRAFT_713716 [Crassisporium funariophilum]|nr:hypothetical protein B0H34DRAFT_713716 [Crassisporium funariophilum]
MPSAADLHPVQQHLDTNVHCSVLLDAPVRTKSKYRFVPSRADTDLPTQKHPPHFALTTSHLITSTFNTRPSLVCPSASTKSATIPGAHHSSPLYVYIENLVQSTQLPFRVTSGALILLQRLYTRLPPDAWEHRAEMSPHGLFTSAYILTAKQHVQLHQAQTTALRGHSQVQSPPSCKIQSKFLSVAYWSTLTSYSAHSLQRMESQLCNALGGNILVFPHQTHGPDTRVIGTMKLWKGFPIVRDLPSPKRDVLSTPSTKDRSVGLDLETELRYAPNLGRMSPQEHLTYFKNMAAVKWNDGHAGGLGAHEDSQGRKRWVNRRLPLLSCVHCDGM